MIKAKKDVYKRQEIPVLLLINKIDLSNQEKLVELVEAWKALLLSLIHI